MRLVDSFHWFWCDIGRGHKLDQPFAERIAERKLRSERSLIQKVTSIFQYGLSELLSPKPKVLLSDSLSSNSSPFGLSEMLSPKLIRTVQSQQKLSNINR